ncbi:hypothetical protein GCM10027048_41300 [Hymenobacter coalescens]
MAALLLGSLPACTVNYYVGGTRPAAPATPQPGYDYDYPAPQPGPVASGPVRTPPPPIRTPPPAQPPVRDPRPPVRTPPPRHTQQPPVTQPSGPPRGGTLPTAPPKPIPQPDQPPLLPTAPPKPIPQQPQQPPHQAGELNTPDQPTTKPPLLPTAPPKPIPQQNGQLTPADEAPKPPLLPTAPPKPIPGQGLPQDGTLHPAGSDQAPQPPRGEGPAGSLTDGGGEQMAARPVLVFRKTPCLGPCPHFEASIYADGRVHYEGYRHVAKVGTHELRLPAETVREMMRQADEVGLERLKGQYMSGATDMPSTYLTYSRPGHPAKTVQVEEGAPAELMSLLTYINNQLERISGGTKADF